MYVCLGAEYCQLSKMKEGRKNLIKGIKIYPFSKIAFFHYFSSLFGKSGYKSIRNIYKFGSNGPR
jgi:hypothetical protein